MIRILLAAVIAVFAFPALAQSSAGSNANSGAFSQSGVSINSRSYRPVGAAIAPSLAVSGISCQGTASFAAGFGGGAFGFGFPTESAQCNARENAKIVGAISGQLAAKETMCDLPKVKAMYRRIGQPCIEDYMAKKIAKVRQERAAAPVQKVSRVVRTFNSMAECRSYAASHPRVTCRAR